MSKTITTNGALFAPALPSGPVTEMYWYMTRPSVGLLVICRQVRGGAPVSVTFTARVGGRTRRLRVIPRH